MQEYAGKNYEIWNAGTCWKIVAKDWYLATEINRLLRYYPVDTAFKRDEEPVFRFSADMLPTILYTARAS